MVKLLSVTECKLCSDFRFRAVDRTACTWLRLTETVCQFFMIECWKMLLVKIYKSISETVQFFTPVYVFFLSLVMHISEREIVLIEEEEKKRPLITARGMTDLPSARFN